MSTPFRLVSYPTRANADGTPYFSEYVTDTNLFSSSRRIQLSKDVVNRYHNKLYRNTFLQDDRIQNYVPLRRSDLTSSLTTQTPPDIGYLNTRFLPFDTLRPRIAQNRTGGAVNPGILEDEAKDTNSAGKYISEYFAPKANDKTQIATSISVPASGVFDIVFVQSIAHANSVFGYFVYDRNNPPQDWSDFQKNAAVMDFVVVTANSLSRRYLTLASENKANVYYDIYGLGNNEKDLYSGDMAPLTYGSLGVDVADQIGDDIIRETDVETTGLPPVGAYHASFRCIVPETYVSGKGVYNIGDNLSFTTQNDHVVQKFTTTSNNIKQEKNLNVLDITQELSDDWNSDCKCDFAISPFVIRDAWDRTEKMMDMTPLNDAIESGQPQDRLFTALPQLNIDGKSHMVRTKDKPIVSEVLQKQTNGNSTNGSYKRLTASAYVYGLEDFKDDGSKPENIDYNDIVFYVRDAEDEIDI